LIGLEAQISILTFVALSQHNSMWWYTTWLTTSSPCTEIHYSWYCWCIVLHTIQWFP